jgi:hypothetical protein
MFEQNRGWLESVAQKLAGQKLTVESRQAEGAGPGSAGGVEPAPRGAAPDRKSALKQQALADPGVQALLEVFPAEVRDVEEM